MANSIMSLDLESIQKVVEPVFPTLKPLADWQLAIAIWEAEIEQAKLRKLELEKIASLLRIFREMLRRLTRKAATLLNADRASIFLLNQSRKNLDSVLAEDGKGGYLLIDTTLDRSIVGVAAISKEIINIPFDAYNDPRSFEAKKTDKKIGYRTYSILAWPLLNEEKNLVAVVQFINKLQLNSNPVTSLSTKIDPKGFTSEDEARFALFAPALLENIKRCQHCYQLIQKLKDEI